MGPMCRRSKTKGANPERAVLRKKMDRSKCTASETGEKKSRRDRLKADIARS